MKNNLGKPIALGILIVVVVLVCFAKERYQKEEVVPQPSGKAEAREEQKEQEPVKQRQKAAKLDKGVLALVNHSKITENYLKERYRILPEEYKNTYKNDKEGFLDHLIIRELLYQEAEKKGFAKGLNTKDAEEKKDAAIEKLIESIIEKIDIPEKEMKDFYNAHKSEVMGVEFEQVKPTIKNYLVQQKEGEVIDRYIEELKNRATIVRNEEWVKKQMVLKPSNPLEKALKSGKPTVLDLGASSCIPCKMMKPIFAELEKEYGEKANILILEISEYRDLARKYRVRVIPTQIFFDKDGREYWRHEGFLSKEEIVKKLKELGVQG